MRYSHYIALELHRIVADDFTCRMSSTVWTLRSNASYDGRRTAPMMWHAVAYDVFYSKDVVDREETVPVMRRNAAMFDTI